MCSLVQQIQLAFDNDPEVAGVLAHIPDGAPDDIVVANILETRAFFSALAAAEGNEEYVAIADVCTDILAFAGTPAFADRAEKHMPY